MRSLSTSLFSYSLRSEFTSYTTEESKHWPWCESKLPSDLRAGQRQYPLLFSPIRSAQGLRVTPQKNWSTDLVANPNYLPIWEQASVSIHFSFLLFVLIIVEAQLSRLAEVLTWWGVGAAWTRQAANTIRENDTNFMAKQWWSAELGSMEALYPSVAVMTRDFVAHENRPWQIEFVTANHLCF